MRKLKCLLILFIGILVIPATVLAEEVSTTGSTSTDKNQEVNIYFFYGDGCGYCASAKEFFESIEKEYGDKFNLIMYETWYDDANATLMQNVADARKEEPEGVPYIIIGNQSWDGYTSSYDEEIIEKIEAEYETSVDERYDIMNYVDNIGPTATSNNESAKTESYADDIAVVIAMVLVVAAVGGGIWFARKKAV